MNWFSQNAGGGFAASFGRVYGSGDELGRGRKNMLLSTIIVALSGQLAGGMFYTAFLLQNGLDKSRIGILTFIPYLACLFNVFSPMVLERFQKRKAILVTGKLLYYLLYIVGITLLPPLVQDSQQRLVWFVILTFVANVINQFTLSGFGAWNAHFLPEHIRADYFATANCLLNAVIWLITLGLSFVGDLFTGTAYETLFLTGIRYLAFAIALVDCYVWMRQKEYPYETTKRTRLSDVFVLPIKNRRFLYSTLMVGLYYFVSCLSNGILNAYILEDIGVSYTLVNGINSVYFLFYFVFSGVAIRLVRKCFWFKAFGWAVLLEGLTFLAYSFVTPGKLWLFVTVRLTQHITGVMVGGIILPGIQYVNIPDGDKTNYFSFYTLCANFFTFLSIMTGSVFTAWFGTNVVQVGALSFTSTQLLLFATGVGEVLLTVLLLLFGDALKPETAQTSS